MIVGFDVTWMECDNKSGGVFQYTVRLISALVEHTNTKVVAIINHPGKGIFEHLERYCNFREVLVEPFFILKNVVEIEQIDVIHTPVQSFSNMTMSVPMITTLHDLQHVYFPEFFTKEEILCRNIFYKKAVEFSERIIVSFEHIKEDVVKFYNISAEKIDVCALGFDGTRHIDQNKFPAIKKKHRLPEKYIFYSANTWRHKNHKSLIQSVKIVREKYGLNISLVCTGCNDNDIDYYTELKKTVKDLDIDEFITFTGYIPEEELLLLLNNAALVVIPTLYEAGSFPLMEAMIYSVPVICSDVTSLPHTIGDKRFVFDPYKVDEIAEAIAVMFKDEKLMEENKANSRARIRGAGWDSVVREFMNSYSKAIEKSKVNNNAIALKTRMHIYEDYAANLIEQMRRQRDKLYASHSWKMTKLLRTFLNFFRK